MFHLGFTKIATFDHNNQGLEFKMSEQQNPMVGPGGMSPSGIESYQPVETSHTSDGKKKKKMSDAAAAQFLFGKMGSVGTDAMSNMGAGSTNSDTIATQLKWDNDSGKYPQDNCADEKESKRHLKKYRKAAGK